MPDLNCDMAIDILNKTNDGNDLDPRELKLIENAVNGFLTDKGMDAFTALHRKIIDGSYRKPDLHDIENLTIDHEGFVYWRGINIEHFTLSWAYSEEAKEKALKLSERCRYLEKIGIAVSFKNVIWDWEKHRKENSSYA